MKTTTLYEAIKQEIDWINGDLDESEQLNEKQIVEATKRFINGNYIWECINNEILYIMNDLRNGE